MSVSTVSYALNDGPRKVAPEVRDRVLAVAREIDYRPNSVARSMATGRTDTIAIVPPQGSHPLLVSPYIHAVINAAVEAAENLGQDILLQTTSETKDYRAVADSLRGGRADGVLVVAPTTESVLAHELARSGIPCVVMSAAGPQGTVTVTVDNAAATRQAMDHLTALGHRRIGHIAGRLDHRDGIERCAAWSAYVRERGLPMRDWWLQTGEFTYHCARAAVHRMLEHPDRPTAVFAANDECGLAAADVAQEIGLRIPNELSIVSFDDLPEYSLRKGSLSSIRQPIRQMTMRAIELLVRWSRNGERPQPDTIVFPTELVVRNTTCGPASATSEV